MRLSQLQSSQPAWQKALAARLAENRAAGTATLPEPRLPWFNLRWQFAAVFAAAVLALGIFFLHKNKIDAPPQSPLATSAPAPTKPPNPAPPAKPAPPMLVASLTLEPGLSRGLETTPVVALAPETQSLSLTLLFLDPPPQKLHLDLLNSARQNIWQRDLRLTPTQAAARRLSIRIPASQLRPGDYRLLAAEPTEHGTEHGAENIASYAYRIIRK